MIAIRTLSVSLCTESTQSKSVRDCVRVFAEGWGCSLKAFRCLCCAIACRVAFYVSWNGLHRE